ncbi:substrate-binding periplasmic protein [Ectobacillus sp. sgz5001026]|uniref:substrate-binding periplasmic protein n=1 Tax=Ectobacillus sp. sgz5001026 TaxID=3242473 RepID=UPI0036D31E12
MFSFKKISLYLIILTLAILTACSNSTKAPITADTTKSTDASTAISGPTIDKIKKSGKLVIATGNYYPFEYHEKGSNNLVGYDIDLGKKLADKLGVTVEWKEMQFTSLIPTLQNGQADLVIAAMYVTDDRKKVIDMSDSYSDTGMVLVKRKDDTSIKSLDDLNGKTVGVKAGAASEQAAKDLVAKGTKLTIKSYKDTTDYLMDLQLGRVDVAFNDYLNQMGYNKQNPDSKLEIVGQAFTKASLGIGVSKGQDDLLKFVNNEIKTMKDSGDESKLFDKWLK